MKNSAETSIDGPMMAIPHLSKEPATSALGATKSSTSEVTNAGGIVAPPPAPGVDKQGAAFAWFRLGGARTVYIALCLLLPVIAALAYWRFNPPSGSGRLIRRREKPSSRLCDTTWR
jgi:hypothetical protein